MPSPSYSITIRAEIENRIGMFAMIAMAISNVGGDLGAVDIVRVEKGKIIRDITVNARDVKHEKKIVAALRNIGGIKIIRVMDRTFFVHQGGKIEIHNKVPIRDRNDLAKVYTPGVARVCMDIHDHPEHTYRYTIKGNCVGIITDGTAVLGLGDIGPDAAMPVMEGKAMIFKEFADIDAFPIALRTKDPDEIVSIVKNICTPFGGINLEDISAPRCFEIETRLRKELDIPVFHDDQHGTAVVVLAGLINVSRFLRKNLRNFRVVILGAGAAAIANALMLSAYGVKDIILCDRAGAIYRGRRNDMNPYKQMIARKTNPRRVKGSLANAVRGANVLIGLAGPNTVTVEHIRSMAKDPILFVLANPEPEIAPEDAIGLVKILATGRSDYPNQVNNMLGYPGIFRGLLDVKAKGVNEEVKFAAAKAIAYSIKDDELHEDYIIPGAMDKKVASLVAHEVAEAARKTGLARK